jgi:hypothetical protein
MNIDLELREILDDVLDDYIKNETLDGLYSTWLYLKGEDGLASFKDFVFGFISGSLFNAYSCYNGRNSSDIQEKEREYLNKLLFNRHYDLEYLFDKFNKTAIMDSD